MLKTQETLLKIAKQEYTCQSSKWIVDALNKQTDFTADELLIIHLAKADNFKINTGETYAQVSMNINGELSTLHVRLDLNQICIDNDLYPCPIG
ncbi:MAG: hypothetical protein HAW67_03560 [Endozoicomonadaceae bacterium]|nr:hypothetical protein [Endozoicomonadaceae bacterium]